MRIALSERATDDIDATRRHIHRDSPRASRRVVEANKGAIDLIAALPEACPIVLPDVRMEVVRRYGLKIFYASSPDVIQVLHVRHPARSPDWT